MGLLSVAIHSGVDLNLQIPANAVLYVTLLALAWIAAHLKPGSAGSAGGGSRRRRRAMASEAAE